jgi:hypothetical protein
MREELPEEWRGTKAQTDLHSLAALLIERLWPDIGVEPLTLPRPRDIAETKARLRAAMVLQQPHVPNGTALVWRTDLLDVHHRAIRMEALAECRAARIAALEAEVAAAREAIDLAARRLDAAAERASEDHDISAAVGYRDWAQDARDFLARQILTELSEPKSSSMHWPNDFDGVHHTTEKRNDRPLQSRREASPT